MKKVLLLMGPSGSGKTTFAKVYAKENKAQYLDFDILFDYKNRDFPKFIETLDALITTSKKDIFVVDGYILNNAPSPTSLEKRLNVEIQLGLCFAAPHIVYKRSKKKAKEKKTDRSWGVEEIENVVSSIFWAISTQSTKEPILVDTSTDAPQIIGLDMFPQRWQELVFTTLLHEAQHDRYYHDISLPSGVNIKGYSNDEGTWRRLSSLVDFKGKSVVDFGPFHGFMSFKAEEAGAKYVLGVEKHKDATKIAQHISWLKKSKVLFVEGDMQTFKLNEKFDIALVLNMLHYLPNQVLGLETAFSSANTAIFEININEERVVLNEAAKYGFRQIAVIDSDRELRKILVFQNEDASSTKISKLAEQQFTFKKRRYLMQTILKKIKQSKIMFPVRYIINKYRQKNWGAQTTHNK